MKKSNISAPGAVVSPSIPPWVKRNASWFVPVAIMAPLTVVTAFLPRLLDHSSKDLDSRIDNRTEQKFKDRRFDDMETSVHQMEGRMETLTETVRILLDQALKAPHRARIHLEVGATKKLREKLVPLIRQDAAA